VGVLIVVFLGFAAAKSLDSLLGGNSRPLGLCIPAVVLSVIQLIMAVVFIIDFDLILGYANILYEYGMIVYVLALSGAILSLVFSAILNGMMRKNLDRLKGNG
jgi:hypothetical protein